MEAVAKSNMRGRGFLIYEEVRKYLVIYEEAAVVIYDFATAPFWISFYFRKILFSFLSVYRQLVLQFFLKCIYIFRLFSG
jgi:hypothetical protein